MTCVSDGELQRIASYALCLDRPDHILMSQYAGGLWTLPGGGIEHGEHPADAVVREVEEETGHLCSVVSLLAVESAEWTTTDLINVHSVNLIYAVRIVGGNLRPELDGTSDRAGWIRVEDLGSTPHTDLVEQALRAWNDT